jgi:hypothetical protein
MVFRWLCFSPPVPLDQDTSRRANFSGATSRARRWRWSTIPTVGRRTHVFTYLASCFHASTIPNLSGRLFSPKPTACLHSFWIIFAVGRKPNPAVQRTGASRFAQGQIQRQGRLAPVADLHVGPERTTTREHEECKAISRRPDCGSHEYRDVRVLCCHSGCDSSYRAPHSGRPPSVDARLLHCFDCFAGLPVACEVFGGITHRALAY